MKMRGLLFLLCGCGTAPTDGTPVQAQQSIAVIHNACGPAGGSAFRLVANTPQTCAANPTGDREEIYVRDDLPSAPTTVAGGGQVCAGSTCESAQSATITFTAISATEATGTYVIKTANGDRTRSFTAPRCNEKMHCF